MLAINRKLEIPAITLQKHYIDTLDNIRCIEKSLKTTSSTAYLILYQCLFSLTTRQDYDLLI